MDQYICINPDEAASLLTEGAIVADIRDPQSFANGHIPGAYNLSNDNLQDFINEAEFEHPLIVCCYHGISSQSAAQFLAHQGFEKVSSLNGGFEGWSATYPEQIER